MTYNEFDNIVNVLFEALEMEQKNSYANWAQDREWTYEDWHDMAHEIVDGCAEVIYTATAWDLVSSVRNSCYSLFAQAEDALEDIGYEFKDIDSNMTALSYQILMNQVMGMVDAKYYPVEAVTA